jgi:hypothetical protein
MPDGDPTVVDTTGDPDLEVLDRTMLEATLP